MKILVHTNQLLYPPDTGGKIRSSQLFERLSRDHDIAIICFRRPTEGDELLERMRACCSRLITITRAETPKYTPRFYAELAANTFSPLPYVVQKYYDPHMEQRIKELLAQEPFDLLLCDFLQPSINAIHLGFRPKLLFQHNVESVIRRRHYEEATNPALKAMFWWQWRKLLRYEGRAARAFDHLIMVSDKDRRTMAELFGARNATAMPTGVDVDFFRPGEGEADAPDLVFTGSMDWLPNQDGAEFMVREVLPLVRERHQARLWIVGRNPTPAVRRLAREGVVEVTGTVDDVRPYVDRAQVYVVPLRVGGGTRIKIFEAMAMAKPVVSTSLGAEGLPVHHGDDILLADDAQGMARAIIGLLDDRQARHRLGRTGRELVERNYTWDAAARRFAGICARVVQEEGKRHAG